VLTFSEVCRYKMSKRKRSITSRKRIRDMGMRNSVHAPAILPVRKEPVVYPFHHRLCANRIILEVLTRKELLRRVPDQE
jgi:hypothetical protein